MTKKTLFRLEFIVGIQGRICDIFFCNNGVEVQTYRHRRIYLKYAHARKKFCRKLLYVIEIICFIYSNAIIPV